MIVSWRLLLTATLLFTSSSLVWSACDVNFHVPSSINATVNSTVVLKCTSQCTPLRIIRAHRDGHLKEESELGKEIEDQNDPYIVNIIVKLNTTFNNTVIFCSTFSNTGAVTSNNVSVIIQDYLGPASDLKFAVIDNRLVFSWSGPSVLKGIKLMYNVQFRLAGNNKTSWANISTSSFSTPLVDPCLEGRFSVTPTADTLTGKTLTLIQHFPKDAPVIKSVKEKFIRKGHTVAIALQYLIPTVDCYGEVHTGGKLFTWCQYSKRHNNYSINNSRGDKINGRAVPVRTRHDIKLSAHDFCFVNVTLQYGAGQITGSQQTINISLFDTQSIKIQANSSTLTICIICQFAKWAIVPGCSIKLDFYYKEGHNSTHAVAFRNHTKEAKHCFRNLASGEYTVRVSTKDYDPHNDSVGHHVAVVGQTVVEFSPTRLPEAKASDMTALWSSLSAVIIVVIVGAVICLTILGVKLWHKKWREEKIPLESPTSQSMDHSTRQLYGTLDESKETKSLDHSTTQLYKDGTLDESKETKSGPDPTVTTESDSKKHSFEKEDSVEFSITPGMEESRKENTSHFVASGYNPPDGVAHQKSNRSSTCESFNTCELSLESSDQATEDTEQPLKSTDEFVNQPSVADHAEPKGNTYNQSSEANGMIETEDGEFPRFRRVPTLTLLNNQEVNGNQ